MTDATRNDRPGPAAGPGGAQGALSGRLREARVRDGVFGGLVVADKRLTNYGNLLEGLGNGALERVIEAIEIEIELGTASHNLLMAYRAMLENVSGE